LTAYLRRAVLALATSADRPDRLDVVYLEEQAVRDGDLTTRDTEGGTPVPSLRKHHVDIEKLDLLRLGKVAEMVAHAHRSNASYSRTKQEVIEIVVQAVRDNLVELDALKEKMREMVRKKLAGSTSTGGNGRDGSG
jgi:hypothetical protein